VYKIKIHITDEEAENPDAIAIDYIFDIDVYYACTRNTISLASTLAD
jgi:hypothetical protein